MNYDNINTTQAEFDYSQAGPRYVSIHIAPPAELTDEQLIEALAQYWRAPERQLQETRAKLAADPDSDIGDEDFETIRSIRRREVLLEEQRRRLVSNNAKA